MNNQNINYVSCLTANNRCWCVLYSRYITIKEMSMLQGINILQFVSDYQLKKQIGNSMSVNVVKAIFNKLL